jgi:hypothetical protein
MNEITIKRLSKAASVAIEALVTHLSEQILPAEATHKIGEIEARGREYEVFVVARMKK